MEYSVTVAGETATFSTRTNLPAMPETPVSTLSPVPGEHLGKTLNRLTAPSRVVLEAGTYPIIGDADVNAYSMYVPKMVGLRGAGVGRTIARLQPNSYTNLAVRPKTAGNAVLRFSPNGGSVRVPTTLSDMTFIGTDQNGADGQPMIRSGLINYYGMNSVWSDLKLVGMTRGGGNSPNTGETFAINSFHDANSRYLRIEVDGCDEAGNIIGGSPFGANNSTNLYLEDCYFHHSLYSGLTFSIAGNLTAPTNGVTTLRVKVEQNANHPGVGAGSRFSGVNHEHVAGPVRHTLLDITLDQAALWDSNHISWGTNNKDNPDMIIDNPNWHGLSPKWANGAFVVSMWGNQVTPPAVKNSDGTLKQPVIVKGQNPPFQKINPLTQYACIVGTG